MPETTLFLLFAQSLVIGLSIAAPVGPVGVLCIQRTLQGGWRVGLASGLGAAVADACYGAVGALGAGALIRWMLAWADVLALGGACFLAWMAWGLWRSTPATQAARPAGVGGDDAVPRLGLAFASVLGLTLTNPMTILSFIAVFTGLAAGAGPVATSTGAAGVMVGGVFTGSALWWGVLSVGVGAVRHRLAPNVLRRIHQGSALLLWALAAGPCLGVLVRHGVL